MFWMQCWRQFQPVDIYMNVAHFGNSIPAIAKTENLMILVTIRETNEVLFCWKWYN